MNCVSVFLLLLSVLGWAAGTRVNECSQGGVVPEEVHVLDCDSEDDIACFVKFNGYINMTMKFTAPHYLEAIKPHLVGKTVFGNFNLTLESEVEDACLGILNSVCPLVVNELIEYSYSVRLIVLPVLPITFEFSIIDTELNEAAVCFSFNVFPVKW